MTRTNFENLRVYVLSEELADLIWTITSTWDGFSRDTIGKQVVRSADSIGANIAEGTGATDSKIISVLVILLGDHYTKQSTGYEEHTNADSSRRQRLPDCDRC